VALFPPYSTRFLANAAAAAGAVSYVVPGDRVAVIRTMTAMKTIAATPVDVLFTLTVTGSGLAVPLWFASFVGVAKIESALWNGNLVLNAGDTVTMQRSGAAGSWSGTVSGFLLTVPP